MPRRFHITGPCVPGRDFMVDWSSRLARPLASLKRGESLLIHRGRQSGKTTYLRELAAALRRDGLAGALCSLQVAEDQSLLGLGRHIEATLHAAYPLPSLPKWNPSEPQSLSLCLYLGEVQKRLGKPLVLLLDEYDAPPRKLTISLLRTFRSALSLQDDSRPFVHAIVLSGKTHVRDLRDELRPTGDETRGSGSLWNIALPVELPGLSPHELEALLADYAKDSGVVLPREARDELWLRTRGQPWLVSRILYQLDEQLGSPRVGVAESSPPPRPTAQQVRAAADQLLQEDCVHLLSVGDVVQGRKEAQELLLRLLGGEEIALSRADEVQSYLLDSGLLGVSDSGQRLEIANPIYEAYLLRLLGD
jgi:hypothetical protein